MKLNSKIYKEENDFLNDFKQYIIEKRCDMGCATYEKINGFLDMLQAETHKTLKKTFYYRTGYKGQEQINEAQGKIYEDEKSGLSFGAWYDGFWQCVELSTGAFLVKRSNCVRNYSGVLEYISKYREQVKHTIALRPEWVTSFAELVQEYEKAKATEGGNNAN